MQKNRPNPSTLHIPHPRLLWGRDTDKMPGETFQEAGSEKGPCDVHSHCSSPRIHFL